MSPEYRRVVAQSLAAMHEIDSAFRRLKRVADDQTLPITPAQREALTNAAAQLASVHNAVGSAFLLPPASAESSTPAPAE